MSPRALATGALIISMLSACTKSQAVSSAPASDSTASDSTASDSTAASSGRSTPPTPATTETAPLAGSYAVEIIAVHPHDDRAYTQGLEFHEGFLLEGTGGEGESDRRWVDIETGSVLRSVDLDSDLFGEGLTRVGDRVIQLTWMNGLAIVSDLEDLSETTTYTYEGQGWGLCFDGEWLIMSDGSSRLTRRDPATFDPESTVTVTDGSTPIDLLNELECRGDQVLANRYGSDEIVAIATETGLVEATIDATPLRPADLPIEDRDFALNGIAHDPGTDHYYLTGKGWPVLYEVRLVSANTAGR